MILDVKYGFDRHNQNHVEKLKYVLAQQGPKRWIATRDLCLYLNPMSYDAETGVPSADFRTVNRLIVTENGEVKRDIAKHGDFAKTRDYKTTGMRMGLRMPAILLKLIELIDPDVLSGTGQERKASLHKLMRTFPEYRIPKRI